VVMVLNSLVPVFLVIIAGYAITRFGLVKKADWQGFQAVTYHVFFPALIATTLATASLREAPVLALSATLVAANLLVVGLTLLAQPYLARRFAIDGPSFTSVFQGVVRWNSFVAVAMAAALHGRAGLEAVAVALAILLPIANITCVLVFNRHGSNPTAPGFWPVLRNLLVNPFIWSMLLGLVLNPFGALIPGALIGFGDILGRAALATGLLMVGAGLDPGSIRRLDPALAFSTVVRLIAMPLAGLGFAWLFGLTGAGLSVAILSLAVPTAAASYLMAKQAGGNAELMAAIVTVQTIGAALTMPVFLALAL
jgi:malonate transporter and related proteins